MRHELFPRPRCCPFNQPCVSGPEFTIVQKRIKSDRDDHYNNFLMLIRLLIVKNVFSLVEKLLNDKMVTDRGKKLEEGQKILEQKVTFWVCLLTSFQTTSQFAKKVTFQFINIMNKIINSVVIFYTSLITWQKKTKTM